MCECLAARVFVWTYVYIFTQSHGGYKSWLFSEKECYFRHTHWNSLPLMTQYSTGKMCLPSCQTQILNSFWNTLINTVSDSTEDFFSATSSFFSTTRHMMYRTPGSLSHIVPNKIKGRRNKTKGWGGLSVLSLVNLQNSSNSTFVISYWSIETKTDCFENGRLNFKPSLKRAVVLTTRFLLHTSLCFPQDWLLLSLLLLSTSFPLDLESTMSQIGSHGTTLLQHPSL